MELRYPNMREELIEILRTFADLSYQERIWLKHELPIEGWMDDLGENINLLEDIGPDRMASEHIIGVILFNQEELDAVQAVQTAIYNALDNVGRGFHIPDEAYIKSPHWLDVVKKAREAYILLTGGQNPEGYFEYIQQNQKNELL